MKKNRISIMSRASRLLLPAIIAVVVPAAGVSAQDLQDLQDPQSLQVMVAGSVGSPRMVDASGASAPLADGASVPSGTTIVTDASSRVAILVKPSADTPDIESDLLLIGPGSRVVLTTTAGGDEKDPVLVATIAQGSTQAVARSKGESLLSLQTGDRPVTLRKADAAVTYEADADRTSFMVKSGSIVIGVGQRRITVVKGKSRVIEGNRVLGARSFGSDRWSRVTGQTAVAGVDASLTKPVAIKPADDTEFVLTPDGLRERPKINANPEPWEYDVERDQYYDAEHGHWHEGPPPADRVAAAGESTATTAPKELPTTQATVGADAAATAPVTAPVSGAVTSDAEYVRLETSMGAITLELDVAHAPISVANFLTYVDDGYYDGTIFHRVIRNFMIQGGGFTADMKQKEPRAGIENEWQNGLKNERGTVAMARLGGRPNSGTSQFFINVQNNPFLDSAARDGAAYAVFGRVVSGMSVIDAIRRVATTRIGQHGDVPVEAITVIKASRVSKAEAVE